jgi:glycosyltransferase involved in cell wall biosynthesis
MRITCLIDHLGSGGAQRQLCTLAAFMQRRGHQVSVVAYFAYDFFLPLLRDADVEFHRLETRTKAGRYWAIRQLLRRGNQDVVLAYLEGPCLAAELAALPWRPWGLVVSERSAIPGSHRARLPWRRWLHRAADYVVTNSHTNRLMLEQAVPALQGRVVTIYNALDLQAFHPAPRTQAAGSNQLRIVIAARHDDNKNGQGFVEALALARAQAPGLDISVDWYGFDPSQAMNWPEPTPLQKTQELARQRGLANHFRIHADSREIAAIYAGADAVALPSFFEGLPNVICEAMGCGRPVLMSNVCDAGNLVVDGRNGYLFDPHSPAGMAEAILKLARMTIGERTAMGMSGRKLAEEMFEEQKVMAKYTEVLHAARTRRQEQIEHWIQDVPQTAHRALA